MNLNVPAADAPLLFFDSGIGGLSVLGPTLALLPCAPIIYAADYAGLPYGAKSELAVATRVCAMLGRLTERYSPRLVVIACNTASTIALAQVRSVLEVPVVGTVPAIKPAALATRSGVIGLLGTESTISQPYVDRLESEFAAGKTMIRYAAPELVNAAEAKMRGETPDPAIFRRAMGGLRDAHPLGQLIDQVVLGCTHFPLVHRELYHAASTILDTNRDIAFIDGSAGIARRVAHLTSGQDWPAANPDRRAVFNGNPDMHSDYLSALADHGINRIIAI